MRDDEGIGGNFYDPHLHPFVPEGGLHLALFYKFEHLCQICNLIF